MRIYPHILLIRTVIAKELGTRGESYTRRHFTYPQTLGRIGSNDTTRIFICANNFAARRPALRLSRHLSPTQVSVSKMYDK